MSQIPPDGLTGHLAQIPAEYLPIYRYASTVSAGRILTIRAWASDLIQRSSGTLAGEPVGLAAAGDNALTVWASSHADRGCQHRPGVPGARGRDHADVLGG
jgi:hypothetical protein